MAQKWGWRISKEGKSVFSRDSRDRSIDSDYKMLKIHSDTETALEITPGDADQHTDVTHNLGYTPAFISYYKDASNKLHFIPQISSYSGFTEHAYAYADATKVRSGYMFDSGGYNKINEDPSDFWNEKFGDNLACEVGNDGGGTSGALRFAGITIAKNTTIVNATLRFYVGVKGSGSGDLKAIIYGIAEDNTSDFGSSPMGKPRTSAFDQSNWSLPAAGNFSDHNITSIVQELVNRSGWASGNAMGFLILDNGSPSDVWAYDSVAGTNSQLVITYGNNITLTFRTIVFKDRIAP